MTNDHLHLTHAGAKGGSSRSAAKRAAAKRNGRKGGRPPKGKK